MSNVVMPDYDGSVAITVKCFEARPGLPEREMPEMHRRYTWPTHNSLLLGANPNGGPNLSAKNYAKAWSEYAKMVAWVAEEVASWLPLYVKAEVWLRMGDDCLDDSDDSCVLAYETMGVVDGN